MNRLRARWYQDLTRERIEMERENVIVLDKSCGNPVMNMPQNILKNYEGDERTYIDRERDEMVSSYKILLLANKASGFYSWVVFNSLDKEVEHLKIIRTVRGLISLSFRCGVKKVNTVKILQYVKNSWTRSHLSGSLDSLEREDGLKQELLKREINHSEIVK